MTRRRSDSRRTAEQGGFTLLELTAALAVAAILLGIGVAAFAALLQNLRMTTTVNDFFIAINMARSEAIQRGARVDLVPADGKSWTSGWVVFVDADGNHRADRGESIVFAHGPVPPGIAIAATLTDSSAPYLAYNGLGRTRTDASGQAPQLGTWSFSQDGKVKRRIKIGFLGRPRTCDPAADSSCTGTADVK
ncbi:MAG TPA: GspH/FimT family protein [Paucimonas sp.]|nr:GspH/FimT family protein [Paucimonas sp.]